MLKLKTTNQIVIILCDDSNSIHTVILFWRLLSGCNVALSACENSSQWEMGLSLLFGGIGGIQCDTALRCNSKHFFCARLVLSMYDMYVVCSLFG